MVSLEALLGQWRLLPWIGCVLDLKNQMHMPPHKLSQAVRI
jgi:hypothetical protein